MRSKAQIGGSGVAVAVAVAAAVGVSIAAAPLAEAKPLRGRHTFVLRSVPIKVGPYDTSRGGGLTVAPRVNGFIVAMRARVVDARTHRPVQQYVVMLHHLLFMDRGRFVGDRHDGACGRDPNERFYGTSEELRALSLPAGYGYRIGARDKWRIAWMLMNHRHQVRSVQIEYRVTVIPVSRSVVPVKPYWLSVVACRDDPQFSVPGDGTPGSTFTRSRSWTAPRAGRIVAIGGHLHGGARSISLDQPRCASTLFIAQPYYAPPADPLYHVYPVLHEPDPKSISWWQSPTGIAIRAGEQLIVNARYDDAYPYMRVMGIMHVYLAPPAAGKAAGAPSDCSRVPPDARTLGASFADPRTEPPHSAITLAAQDAAGIANPITQPPGPLLTTSSPNITSVVRSFHFLPANLSIPSGASVTWRFPEPFLHDTTVANGPRGFASNYSSDGSKFHWAFTVPGTYRIYCSLHPTLMSQVVTVRP